GARGRQVGEGLERDLDRVAHAADVEHEPLGALLAERAGERRDHARPAAASARATRWASGARWRWQRAMASASAASGAGARPRPSRSPPRRPIAVLSASPWPPVPCFPWAGSDSARPPPSARPPASTPPPPPPSR